MPTANAPTTVTGIDKAFERQRRERIKLLREGLARVDTETALLNARTLVMSLNHAANSRGIEMTSETVRGIALLLAHQLDALEVAIDEEIERAESRSASHHG